MTDEQTNPTPPPKPDEVLASDSQEVEIAGPQTEAEIMKPVDFKEGIFGMRSDIELIKAKVLDWKKHPAFLNDDEPKLSYGQKSEMMENLKLAYRHLEDARMRLGKAIQAFDGGKSCYPG